jgi:hypothetical protein
MSDDAFPSVDDLEDAPPRKSARKSARKPAKRARRAAKKKTSKRTAKEEKVLREAGLDIFDDEDVEAPPKRSGPKSGVEKTADKIINDLFKKAGAGKKMSAAERRKKAAAAADLTKKLMGIGNTPIGKLAKTGGALAIGTTAALALLAGTASYYGTSWIIDRLAAAREARTPAAIKFHAAMAYRQARLDAERKLMRPLASSEQQYLASQFKQKLATIGG